MIKWLCKSAHFILIKWWNWLYENEKQSLDYSNFHSQYEWIIPFFFLKKKHYYLWFRLIFFFVLLQFRLMIFFLLLKLEYLNIRPNENKYIWTFSIFYFFFIVFLFFSFISLYPLFWKIKKIKRQTYFCSIICSSST